jgi:hypothetical protein
MEENLRNAIYFDLNLGLFGEDEKKFYAMIIEKCPNEAKIHRGKNGIYLVEVRGDKFFGVLDEITDKIVQKRLDENRC